MKRRKTEKLIVLVTAQDKKDLVLESRQRDIAISQIVREAIQNRKKETT